MSKNILFISYDGMTDPLGQSQVIPYLIGLTRYGYTFTILSCDKPDRFKLHKDYVQKIIDPYPIKWVSIPYHKYPPVLSSWYDYRMLRKTAVALHKLQPFNLVHTRAGLPALVGYWLKKHLGIKMLNDIRGFWADERIDSGIWSLKNPVYKYIYRYFKKMEDNFISTADYNTCLTYAAQKEIHNWKHLPNQPVPLDVIPCCADMDLFDPQKITQPLLEQLKKELGIKDDDIIVSYLGSIGGIYMTEEMIRFCKLLNECIPKTKFLFISPSLHEAIVAAAEKYNLSADKLVVKFAKRHQVPLLLSLSSYAVFFMKPCYSKMATSPTKHGEIMAMGIPVITNSGVGDVAEIVEKYHSGYIIHDFTDKSFKEVVQKILQSNSFDKAAIRNGGKDYYALETAVERYKNVYQKIFNKA